MIVLKAELKSTNRIPTYVPNGHDYVPNVMYVRSLNYIYAAINMFK